MTTADLFTTIALLCMILITGFLCATLFYAMNLFRVWYRASREIERNVERCGDRFQEAMHSLMSLRSVVEIGMKAVQGMSGLYRTRSRSSHKQGKKKEVGDKE